MKQIAKAILAVQKECKGMEKNSRVGSGNYAYDGTKDQDVKEVFNELLTKNGLSMMPIDIDEEHTVSRWTDQYGKQKQQVFCKVKVKYLLLHSSGESLTLCGIGHGVDAMDKAAGKATTYAMKNCLLYTFLTPVGKMDDTDTTHSNDHATPQKKPSYPVANYTKGAKSIYEGKCTLKEIEGKYTVSAAAKKTINAIVDKFAKNDSIKIEQQLK